MNETIKNIIIGSVVGLIVLIIQLLIDYFKNAKNRQKDSVIGNSDLKILNKEFLYDYEPGKVSIEKIIQDFGQPNRIKEDIQNEKKLKLFF